MKRYLIIIEKGAGNYGAYCPDLPGCISTGDTVEETTKNMQEAIQFHLDGMREDGLPNETDIDHLLARADEQSAQGKVYDLDTLL